MANSVDTKRSPNRRPSPAVSPSTGKPPAEPIELPEGMRQRIAHKAYGFYERRGMRDGFALEDWSEAGVHRRGGNS